MADDVSRSWFCVFNNPADHGYSGEPEEVCNKLRDEWISISSTRCGAWCYCVSEKGLHHIHMVLEDEKPMRFSTIKKEYAIGMHFEPTKGTKRQAEDYIHKVGPFAEKGEIILYSCSHGELQGRQGKRSDLDGYYERIEAGETVSDILRDTPKAYAHISVLKSMYYDIRSSKTPLVRKMKVFWHTGNTGTGKSYERIKLCQKYGEDNIFYLTAFNSGSFDNYNGQPILWIEDFRGEFKLQELLRILDCYKAEVPARYTNVKALWTEVHITSILTPRECYSNACKNDTKDRIEQLLRRLSYIVYHFKSKDNDYLSVTVPPDTLRSTMEQKAKELSEYISSFVPILQYDELPVDMT